MRHRVAHRKLGRVTEHRLATLRNLSQMLLRHERIDTTLAKAKELRPFIERLITVAKRGLEDGAGTPRAFNLDPEGRFLFAAGQANGQLAAYRIDQNNGRLSPLATYNVGPSPSWVMILKMVI